MAIKIYDIVKWDDTSTDANKIVAYRHEAENFNTHTQLIVQGSQEAIFMKDGMYLDVFESGRHTLKTQNIPLLGKLINIPTGGETPFTCKVYFVNKVHLQDLKWGTANPIQMEDPMEGVNVHVRAFGEFGAYINDTRRLLEKVVGTQGVYTKTELQEYLTGLIKQKVTDLLGKTITQRKIGILEVSAHYNELSDAMADQIRDFFGEFGIAIERFSFISINVPDSDIEAINKAKIEARQRVMEARAAAQSMDIESEALARKRAREGYSYQQERGMDVMEKAAQNEGASGTLMGAGMGLGMGFGMGGAFQQGMGGIASNTLGSMNNNPQGGNPQQGGASGVCPDCGNPVQPGAKFCPNCGKQLGNKCPKCGADVPAGSKFCPSCGQSLSKKCPNCGHDVGDAKFCPDCGTKIE